MTADQSPSGYLVAAFRCRRDYLLGCPTYSQTVLDAPGLEPAAERADALRRDLLERSARNRLGWRYVTSTPLADPEVDPKTVCPWTT